MLPRKLTPSEITKTVEKIRARYDDYTYRFLKPPSIRRAFEERYLDALRSSVDISSFLLAEISAVEELIRREEERISAPLPSEPPRPGIADRVLEEHRRRIEPYPPVAFHQDAGEELQRLFGALRTIGEDHWPPLSARLREAAAGVDPLEIQKIDSQLRLLASADREGVPPLLQRYAGELRRFPRDYAALEGAEKEYLLEAAFFLHDLAAILGRVGRTSTHLEPETRRRLEATLTWVRGVIADFRLKDLRRRRIEER